MRIGLVGQSPRGTNSGLMAGEEDSFKRARSLLLGAVDTVMKIAAKERDKKPAPTSQQGEESTSASICSGRGRSQVQGNRFSTGFSEHQRLFGFQPSKMATNKGKGKRTIATRRKPGRNTWRKDCICLRDRQQAWKPSPEEKMELARMGLGMSEVVFSADGDAEHIHSMLTTKFPVLLSCCGYTLLRLGENSRSLVEIETPDCGLTVPYLKDILHQAKLFIRPLQSDITVEDMKPFRVFEDDTVEPSEVCRKCDSLLPLSQLRRHVADCKGNEDSDSVIAAGDHKGSDVGINGSRAGEGSHSSSAPMSKRRCPEPQPSKSTLDSPLHSYPSPCYSSPLSPSPEPLSPTLKPRKCGSATYSSFVNLISDSESDWENDPAVQIILQQSADGNSHSTSDQGVTLEEVIARHRAEVLYEDQFNCHRITVRRRHIFDDTLVAIRSGFDEKKHLRVTFLGESAVDGGGPRREFFMLLMGAIANNGSLLDGPPDRRVLRHNTTAIQEELYLCIGKIMALSILHGGPGPVFLVPVVVDYLFGGISKVKPCVDDVPDALLQSQIRKLANAENAEQFRALLCSEEYEFLYTSGVSKPATRIPFSDKDKVVAAMSLHYSVLVCLAELEQLRRGLAIQKFASLMESFPEILRKAFQPSETKITSSFIQDLFVPILSPRGSNKRDVEEAILMNWIHYIQDLEGQEDSGTPTLKDLMAFLTGSDSVPPLGFGDVSPSI